MFIPAISAMKTFFLSAPKKSLLIASVTDDSRQLLTTPVINIYYIFFGIF